MQSYSLKLTAGQVRPFSLAADLFVYESGTVGTRTNYLPYSEGNLSQLSSSSNVTDAGTTITGFASSIAFASTTVGHAYKTITAPAGVLTLSVFVQMDDGMAPVLGQLSPGVDFGLVFEHTFIPNSPTAIEQVQAVPGLYRVRVTATSTGAVGKNFGVVKYSGMSARGFRVTGFMLEANTAASPYIKNTTAAPVTSTEGDTTIKIKPDSGAEMYLRPGQRFRLAPGEKATNWQVAAVDKTIELSGAIIIGSGEFDDANTLNKVQLDATFANVVKVNNTPAERVPVAFDPTATLNTAPLMSYNAFKSFVAAAAGSYNTALIPASENLNGVIVEQLRASGSALSFLAKATVPTGYNDASAAFLNSVNVAVIDRTRIKVPAGQAVWIVNQQGSVGNADVIYTVL